MKNYLTILITFLALGLSSCSNVQKEEGVKHITVTEFKNLDFEYQLNLGALQQGDHELESL